MNKQRKTSNILNVFQYDETTGAVTLPSTLVLTAPAGSDNSTKVPTTAWTRSYISSLGYVTGNQSISITGDATGSGSTSIELTLANTAVTPGTYGSATLVPVVTVDSKGRITSVTTASISGALTFTGDVTGTGTTGSSTTLTLANSGVTAGTYTKVTVDSKGRVTVGANATTSDISEGTNLYYTDARVLAYLGANNYATQSYVTTQINNLVAGAPGLLDTLDELAAALGDDANFATTTATSLGNRLRIDIGTQGLTSTQQGYGRANLGLGTAALSATGDFATAAQGTKADTAFGWGNHASAGYLTTSSAASTYVSLTGSYANPSWITSLAYSKITGVPAFLTSYTEVDTLASVTGRGASTSTAVTFSTSATIGRALIDFDGTDTWFRMQSGNRMRITTTGGTDFIIPNTGNMTYNGNIVLHAGNYSSYALPLSGGTMSGVINMSGTQIILGSGFAGIEYHNTLGQWEGYVGTESGSGQLRYNSRQGNHTWYSNSSQAMKLNSGGTLDIYRIRAGGNLHDYEASEGVIRMANNQSNHNYIISNGTGWGSWNQWIRYVAGYNTWRIGTFDAAQESGESVWRLAGRNRSSNAEVNYIVAGPRGSWGSSDRVILWNPYARYDGGSYNGDGTHYKILDASNYTSYTYSTSDADSRFLRGTTSPGSVNNFTISIGNNGSYSYVQSHSGQPLRLNPVGNTIYLDSTTYAGSLYANIIYDGNDSGYYLDPHSTSELRNLYLGAHDSGTSEFLFGENSSGWYGMRWYWDSGVNFYWYGRNAGTDTLIMNYTTNDNAYLKWHRSFHLNGSSIDYVGSLYLQNGPGVHLQGNTDGSYGSLQITQSKNGWSGIYFTASGNSLMANNNQVGHYQQGVGWKYRWYQGTMYISRGTNGGGTEYTVVDTGNISSYTSGNTNSISAAVGGSYTWTSTNYFRSNLGGYSGSLSNPPLQAYSDSNNSAFMSFHKGGHYAVNFGLDADNVLRIGGWSASASRWELDMSGNNSIPGYIRANGGFGTNGAGSGGNTTSGRVYGPAGGAYSFSGGGITGAIKIRLPFRNNDCMWSMKVRIYNYSTNETSEYLLGNYAYSQGGWNSSASFIGGSSAVPRTVRFGNEGGYDCVWIGETSTSWSYPVISIMDFAGGYSNGGVNNYLGNWDITITQSIGTVGTTITPAIRFSDVTTASITATSINAPSGYVSNGNPWGTSNSAFFPNGITTAGGTNWIYGQTYIGNAPSNGDGHNFSTSGVGESTREYNIGKNSGNNWGLGVYYGNDVSGYGRIRFYQGGSNHNTIHSFCANWQNSSLASGSTGAINIEGQYGVTFGAWNVVDAYITRGGSAWFRYDVTAYSDSRVKTNVKVVDNAIEKIQAIRGVTFNRTDKTDTDKRYAGVIAQEVLPILPEVVTQDTEGMYSVSYGNMAALFIEAIKEQQTQIEDLKNKLDLLTQNK
jgi:hypothetical protein